MRSNRFAAAMVILVGLVLSVHSCVTPEKKKNVIIEDNIPATVNVSRPLTVSGVNETLPVLFISVADFKKFNGNLIFRFFIDSALDLSLKGWKKPANNTPAIVNFNTSVLSNVKLGADEYLGNLYIKANDVDQIIKKADGKFLTLKFVPFIDTTNVSKGQITYKIILTNQLLRNRRAIPSDSLNMLMDMAFPLDEDTKYMLNPSPPRAEQ
jgi:hypothetical protein